MAKDIRQLLYQKNLSGDELGRALILNLIEQIEHKKIIFTGNDFDILIKKLTNQNQLDKYNRYAAMHNWLQHSSSITQAFFQQAQNGLYRLFFKVTTALYIEQNISRLQRLPVIMSEQYYEKHKQEEIKKFLSNKTTYVDLIILALESALNNEKQIIQSYNKRYLKKLQTTYCQAVYENNTKQQLKQFQILVTKYGHLYEALKVDIKRQEGAEFLNNIAEANYWDVIISCQRLYEINFYDYKSLIDKNTDRKLSANGVAILKEDVYDREFSYSNATNSNKEVLENLSFLTQVEEKKEIEFFKSATDYLKEGIVEISSYNTAIKLIEDYLQIPNFSNSFAINTTSLYQGIVSLNGYIISLKNNLTGTQEEKEKKLEFINSFCSTFEISDLEPKKTFIDEARDLIKNLTIFKRDNGSLIKILKGVR